MIKANFLGCVMWGQLCIQVILTPYIVKDSCSTCLQHTYYHLDLLMSVVRGPWCKRNTTFSHKGMNQFTA